MIHPCVLSSNPEEGLIWCGDSSAEGAHVREGSCCKQDLVCKAWGPVLCMSCRSPAHHERADSLVCFRRTIVNTRVVFLPIASTQRFQKCRTCAISGPRNKAGEAFWTWIASMEARNQSPAGRARFCTRWEYVSCSYVPL